MERFDKYLPRFRVFTARKNEASRPAYVLVRVTFSTTGKAPLKRSPSRTRIYIKMILEPQTSGRSQRRPPSAFFHGPCRDRLDATKSKTRYPLSPSTIIILKYYKVQITSAIAPSPSLEASSQPTFALSRDFPLIRSPSSPSVRGF